MVQVNVYWRRFILSFIGLIDVDEEGRAEGLACMPNAQHTFDINLNHSCWHVRRRCLFFTSNYRGRRLKVMKCISL